MKLVYNESSYGRNVMYGNVTWKLPPYLVN